MSENIGQLFIILKQLRKMLEETVEKTGKASKIAVEISGEFEQELSTDLDSLQVELQGHLDDLDSIIDEGETLREDSDLMESSMRSGLVNEENYKVNDESTQEEIKQEQEKKQDPEKMSANDTRCY